MSVYIVYHFTEDGSFNFAVYANAELAIRAAKPKDKIVVEHVKGS